MSDPIAWHYTTGEKFLLIVESGVIRPSDGLVFPPERPIAWFSLEQHFEMTARKAVMKDGRIRTMTIQETKEVCGGLCRFGVAAERLIAWKGGALRKAARMSHAIAKALELYGRKQGANPHEWLGSLEPVPVDECAAVGFMGDNGQWLAVTRDEIREIAAKYKRDTRMEADPATFGQGAQAFKRLLVRLVASIQASQTGDFDPYALAPILQSGCLAPMGEAEAAGFWQAFALMLGTELAASEFDPEDWCPMANLAVYEREGTA